MINDYTINGLTHTPRTNTLTMNINFSSATGPALLVEEEAVYPTNLSQNVRDPERVSPLPGNKRPRQDDSIPECRGRSKIARSSVILTQRSNTMKALKLRLSKTKDAGLMEEETAASFVRNIERLLFLSTSPDEENLAADTEQALNSRLSQLLGAVMSRRILREKGPEDRLKEFERVLGPNMVQDIAAVCREIDRVKLEPFNGCCSRDGVCTMKGRDAYPGVNLRGKIPKPVRNLFFCTRMPDIWNCETNSVHCLAVQEWNELYVEAVQNLKMYRECMRRQRE